MAHLYHKGKNIVHHPERALFWYSQSAEGGYAQAQFILGTLYERGTGTDRSYKKAADWYSRATENGSAYVCPLIRQTQAATLRCCPALMITSVRQRHRHGDTIGRMKKIIFLLVALLPYPANAAHYSWVDDEQTIHYADAKDEIPITYRDRVTKVADTNTPPSAAQATRQATALVKEDKPEQAIALLLPYAKQGDARIQYRVAHLYHKGKNIVHHPERALFWYSQSAEGGYAQAQFILGTLYERGTGTDRSYKKAADWYSRATENGSAYAPYRLAFLLREGQGVPQDKTESQRLFHLSAERGYTPAAYELGITPPKRGVNTQNSEEIRTRYRDRRIVAPPVIREETAIPSQSSPRGTRGSAGQD